MINYTIENLATHKTCSVKETNSIKPRFYMSGSNFDYPSSQNLILLFSSIEYTDFEEIKESNTDIFVINDGTQTIFVQLDNVIPASSSIAFKLPFYSVTFKQLSNLEVLSLSGKLNEKTIGTSDSTSIGM